MAQPQAGDDARFAASVVEHFEAFLENYSSEPAEGMDTSAADEAPAKEYMEQVRGGVAVLAAASPARFGARRAGWLGWGGAGSRRHSPTPSTVPNTSEPRR